jgi:hypothetical protein
MGNLVQNILLNETVTVTGYLAGGSLSGLILGCLAATVEGLVMAAVQGEISTQSLSGPDGTRQVVVVMLSVVPSVLGAPVPATLAQSFLAAVVPQLQP